MGVPFHMTKIVAVNACGIHLGEDHHRATLSDHDVELIRELADPTDGARPLSHRQIADKFGISRGTVGDIVNFRRRATTPSGYKRVPIAQPAIA